MNTDIQIYRPLFVLVGSSSAFVFRANCLLATVSYLREARASPLTLLGLQSRFGDNSLGFRLVCPQIGTAVLKGLTKRVLNGNHLVLD